MSDDHPSLWRIDFRYCDDTESPSVIGFGLWVVGSESEAKATASDIIGRSASRRPFRLESIRERRNLAPPPISRPL
jgi:hypothetical protein